VKLVASSWLHQAGCIKLVASSEAFRILKAMEVHFTLEQEAQLALMATKAVDQA
jgi:hypothetical protein